MTLSINLIHKTLIILKLKITKKAGSHALTDEIDQPEKIANSSKKLKVESVVIDIFG